MPYNTRRKSLSLPSLGIHLPHSASRLSKPSHPPGEHHQMPPSKKVKRSHDSLSPDPEPLVRTTAPRGSLQHTPPPSPTDPVGPKIDTEGINDDIVVAVLQQLEKTGNRPHLVKELAAVLISRNENDSVTKYVIPSPPLLTISV